DDRGRDVVHRPVVDAGERRVDPLLVELLGHRFPPRIQTSHGGPRCVRPVSQTTGPPAPGPDDPGMGGATTGHNGPHELPRLRSPRLPSAVHPSPHPLRPNSCRLNALLLNWTGRANAVRGRCASTRPNHPTAPTYYRTSDGGRGRGHLCRPGEN